MNSTLFYLKSIIIDILKSYMFMGGTIATVGGVGFALANAYLV